MWSIGYNQISQNQTVPDIENNDAIREDIFPLQFSDFKCKTKSKNYSSEYSYNQDINFSQKSHVEKEVVKTELINEDKDIKNQSRNSEIDEDFVFVERSQFVKKQIEKLTLESSKFILLHRF